MTRRRDTILELALVRAWLEEAGTFRELLRQHQGELPICGLVLELQAQLESENIDGALIRRIMQAIEGLATPEWRLLCCLMTAVVAAALGNRRLTESVLLQAEAELSQVNHRILLLSYYNHSGLIAHGFGQDLRAGEHYGQVASLCRFSTPRETRCWLGYADFCVKKLRSQSLLGRLESLARSVDAFSASLARGLLWSHDSLSGVCRLSFPDMMPSAIHAMSPTLLLAAGWRARLTGKALEFPFPVSRKQRGALLTWMRGLDALESREYSKASRLLHYPAASRPVLDIYGHLPVMLQLVSGKPVPPAMLRAVEARRPSAHPLDDLLLARVRALQGREAEAGALFRCAQAQARTEGLERRFEYELDLSHEVPPSRWVAWTGSSGAGGAGEPAGLLPDAGSWPMSPRLGGLKALFLQHRYLHRDEAARQLHCSRTTATRDLRQLMKEGLVAKRIPTTSPRTHYFEWVGEPNPM